MESVIYLARRLSPFDMGVVVGLPPLRERVFLYALVENLAYWLTSAVVWVPWYFSDTAGMVVMVVFVPLTMGVAALYCLDGVPVGARGREAWVVAGVFIVTCAVIDLFFWVIWRGHDPVGWYLPVTELGVANFIGYMELLVIPRVVGFLASRVSWIGGAGLGSRLGWRGVAASGVALFLFSVYCAVYIW